VQPPVTTQRERKSTARKHVCGWWQDAFYQAYNTLAVPGVWDVEQIELLRGPQSTNLRVKTQLGGDDFGENPTTQLFDPEAAYALGFRNLQKWQRNEKIWPL